MKLWETIKGVTQGTFNLLVVKEEIEKMSAERMAICRTCPFNSEVARANGQHIVRQDEHCLKCGCVLKLKTRVPSAHCPLPVPKWTSLASDEESEKIMDLLEKNAENENSEE